MKRILYVILVSTLFLSSCQVYKPGMESAQYDPLPIKLGNLDYNFTHENFSGYNNLIFNMMDKTISSEIQKNIIQGEEIFVVLYPSIVMSYILTKNTVWLF